MKEIHRYADALRLGLQYIPVDAVPIEGQFFQMIRSALQTTLSYIFQYLHHNCYMACIADNKLSCIVKLASRTTAPLVKKALAEALRNLGRNRVITDAQRTYINKNIKTGNWRIMQCIVKRYKAVADDAAADNNFLYERALRAAEPLPNGVFILSLTDAAILRYDGMYPFTCVLSEKCPAQYLAPNVHLPLFCLSGQRGYADIPLPTYDDLEIAMDVVSSPKYETNWSHKRNGGVFRGGPTGCGTAPDSNQRLHLATLDDPPKLDVGIALKNARPGTTVQSNSIRFDPIHGLSMINTRLKYKPVVLMPDQSRCKYIIHVDGNALAYRLLNTMLTGSLILRVESQYVSWADRDLRAFEHYVPVRADLADLHTKLKWCEDNDTECRHIAANARAYAVNALTPDVVFRTIRDTMWDAIPAEIGADIASISLTADLTAGKPSNMKRCTPSFRATRVAGKQICFNESRYQKQNHGQNMHKTRQRKIIPRTTRRAVNNVKMAI